MILGLPPAYNGLQAHIMDTTEARTRMREMALEALTVVERLRGGEGIDIEAVQRLRRLALDARGCLADAGYPGEAVWQGLQRASIGLDTQLGSADPSFWEDIIEVLQSGAATLESLVSARGRREGDFRIVG